MRRRPRRQLASAQRPPRGQARERGCRAAATTRPVVATVSRSGCARSSGQFPPPATAVPRVQAAEYRARRAAGGRAHHERERPQLHPARRLVLERDRGRRATPTPTGTSAGDGPRRAQVKPDGARRGSTPAEYVLRARRRGSRSRPAPLPPTGTAAASGRRLQTRRSQRGPLVQERVQRRAHSGARPAASRVDELRPLDRAHLSQGQPKRRRVRELVARWRERALASPPSRAALRNRAADEEPDRQRGHWPRRSRAPRAPRSQAPRPAPPRPTNAAARPPREYVNSRPSGDQGG